jgi:hypothetical protein
MRSLIIIVVALILGLSLWLVAGANAPTSGATVHYEPVAAEQTSVTWCIRETGELVASDPVLVKNRFQAELKWVIEDGSWVESGETVYVVSTDKVVEKVGKMRSELLTARQELALARLEEAHAREAEARKVRLASRKLALEQTRYQILTATPKGGQALVEIHEDLLPREQELRTLRNRYERMLDQSLAAQDAMLAAEDAYESKRQAWLRNRAVVDELTAIRERDPSAMQPPERAEHEASLKRLSDAETAVTDGDDSLPRLKADRQTARRAYAELQAPLAAAHEALQTQEAGTRGLYIRLEIEKRGAALARLQLDERSARLRLEEANRKLADGKAAFADGAISRAALDKLAAAQRGAVNALDVTRQEIRIEERPPAPEELAEAKVRLEKAEAAAASAQKSYDQAMAIKQAKIKVTVARIAKLDAEIAYAARYIPDIISANIKSAEKELEMIDDDPERQAELARELTTMRQRLEAALKQPPHIYKAPISGIVRLKFHRDRVTRPGDEWREEDAVVMIYPPANLEVQAFANEVNVRTGASVGAGRGCRPKPTAASPNFRSVSVSTRCLMSCARG